MMHMLRRASLSAWSFSGSAVAMLLLLAMVNTHLYLVLTSRP